MSIKPRSRKRSQIRDFADEAVDDAEIERFLGDRHSEIEEKLNEARKSIARGDATALEPLPTLLRGARRSAKAAR
jgi:hypothetical protein